MAKKYQTPCCALCQITAGNKDSKQTLSHMIEKLKEEAKEVWNTGDRRSGERAAYVIVSPGEDKLEDNLIELGFNMVTVFPRRNGYPDGILKMYILNW